MARWDSLRLTTTVAVSSRRGAILSDPVVGADGIYIGDRKTETVKLRRSDLRELWRIPSEQRTPTRRLCGEAILIMGGDGARGLSTATGGRLWTEAGRLVGLSSQGRPLVAKGQRLLAVLDPMTGDVLETVEMPEGQPEVVCGDVMVLPSEWLPVKGFDLDPVRGFDLPGRRLLWERNLRTEILAAHDVKARDPLLHFVCGGPGRFVVACGASTLGCSLEDGRVLWHAPVAVTYNWPNVYEGRVYVAYLDRSIAIDEATGEVLYEVLHPELRGAALWRPGTVYGETIAFANESGLVAIFDRRDGNLVETHEYKAPLWGTAEADGRLLVSTGDGKLLVFEEKPPGSKRGRNYRPPVH
jgi:outer membrane protein assembly factor BamB